MIAPQAPGLTSIVIPTFNRRELVLRAVQSVLDQRGGHALEIIIVDDGSTDGTSAALALRYQGEPRVRVIAGERRHSSAARNAGLAAARGAYVCFLDSDDCWLPDMLAAVHAVFARHPELAFVSADGATLARAGAPALERVVAGDSPGWRHPRFPRGQLVSETVAVPGAAATALLRGDFFPAIVNGDLFYLSALVMRRDCAAAAGPFNERFRYFNDWEFFARLCLSGPGAYLAFDGFRRDTGRDDQISRRRPITAMARRHLFIVRTLARRSDVATRYRTALDAAERDAEYRLAHCLWLADRDRRARGYLWNCIRRRHKPLRSAARLLACLLHLRPRRHMRTGW